MKGHEDKKVEKVSELTEWIQSIRTHVEAISMGASAAFHGRYLNPYRNHMETIVETMDMKDMLHRKLRKCDEILESYMRNIIYQNLYVYFLKYIFHAFDDFDDSDVG